MSFRRKRLPVDEINVTPMIDVLLVLLIFFLVASHFGRDSELAIQLPSADGDPAADSAETVEIAIARDGSYAVNGARLVNRDPATLAAALRQVAAARTDLPVVINADADASHQAVVSAMDTAGRAGFHRLRIATRSATTAVPAATRPVPAP